MSSENDNWPGVRQAFRDYARHYAGGLPGAPGSFAGLVPVEIDTYDNPNPAADMDITAGAELVMTVGGRTYRFPVDHAEHAGGNRWRFWCVRAGMREVTGEDDGSLRAGVRRDLRPGHPGGPDRRRGHDHRLVAQDAAGDMVAGVSVAPVVVQLLA